MTPHFPPWLSDSPPASFPALPIVTPGPPRRSERLSGRPRDRPDRELAGLLPQVLRSEGAARDQFLDRATLWLRPHHSEAARLWAGWEVRDG